MCRPCRGTGAVGGLLDAVGELLGGLLSLASSDLPDGEPTLAARLARVTIEFDKLWRDTPEPTALPGELSDAQRLAVRERVGQLAKGVAGLRDGFPQRHLQRPAAQRRTQRQRPAAGGIRPANQLLRAPVAAGKCRCTAATSTAAA